MSNEVDEYKEPWLSEHALKILVGLLFVAIVVSVLAVWFYFSRFGLHPEGHIEKAAAWGQLGDFFGGTLNPIFGLLSVLALFVTIVYQRSELKLSRDELKLSREELGKSATALAAQNSAIDRQRFEQTFFSWLSLYSDQVAAIEAFARPSAGSLAAELPVLKGRAALNYLWDKFLKVPGIQPSFIEAIGLDDWDIEFKRIRPHYPGWIEVPSSSGTIVRHSMSLTDEEFGRLMASLNPESAQGHIVKAAALAWEALYCSEQHQLDSVFRSLYRLVRWIDSQPEERLSGNEKWEYVQIIRSQLSFVELVYLFYNGLTERSDRFRVLMEKYALLDNLKASEYILGIVLLHKMGEPDFRWSTHNSDSARDALGLSVPQAHLDTRAPVLCEDGQS